MSLISRSDEFAMATEVEPDRDQRGDARKTGASANGSPAWAGMASVGFEFVLAILIPGAVGWWLDGRFGWQPWLMLVGGLLGFIAGLRLLMRSVGGTTKTTTKR